MASDITLSSAVRSNLLSLQNTADLLGSTQEKLSTGLKVNSALDDPTAFFTASCLNSRANDLSRLQDFVSNSVQTLEAADKGIQAITKLVESAEATARQALNSAGQNASATGTTDITGDTSLAQVDTNTATVTATASSFDNFTASGTSSGVDFSTVDLDITAAVNAGGSGLDTAVVATADDAKTFTITDTTSGNATADITIEAGDDTDAIVTKINDAVTASAIGNTDIVASNVGGQVTLTVANGANARADDTAGTGAGAGASGAVGLTDGAAGGVDTNIVGAGGFAGSGLVSDSEDGLTFTISDGTNTTANITLTQGASSTDLATTINAALTTAGITDISADGSSGEVDLASTNGASITVLDTGTAGAAAALDLSQTTATASNATFTQGDQFSVNGTTLTFGTGTGEFNSVSELTTALNNIDGVSASVDGSNNLVITSTGDDLNIAEVGGGSTAANLGLTAALGTTDATNTLGSSIGDSFSVTVGGTTTNITYGAGTGEVNTRAELTAALEDISGIASASFNGSNQLVVTSDANTSISFADVTGTPLTELGVADANTVTESSVGIEQGDTFTVQVGSAAATTITFGSATGQVDTDTELVAALNAIDNIRASVDDNGGISIEATNGEDLTLTEGTNTPLSDLGITAGTSTASSNSDRAAFATQFNDLRTQINELAADASYNGNNLLDGDDLTVTFNEDSTSTLTVEGVNFNANGLGIDAAANTFQTDGDINAALSDLETATATLRAQSSKFGSNLSVVETRQDFTKELINVLETGAANLTLADTNEEGANLLALQTRQQLSSTALSLASQADQNVLRLF